MFDPEDFTSGGDCCDLDIEVEVHSPDMGWGAGPWGRGTWGQLNLIECRKPQPTIDVFFKGGGGGKPDYDVYYPFGEPDDDDDDVPEVGKGNPRDDPDKESFVGSGAKSSGPTFYPDDVMEPGAWEKWKQDHPPEPPQHRPVIFNFASDLKPRSRERVLMLLKEAETRKLGLEQTDAFLLKMKLRVFGKDMERKMQGGTMVRVVPATSDLRVEVVKLGMALNFRLVAYDQKQVFMFDNETFNTRIPPIAWVTLGAGIGMWLLADFQKDR